MRKKALIGFAFLIVLLVVCFFFSGTIKTLTTPKVMITQPKQGRLKEEIALTGYLTFSETADINLPDVPEGVTLTITKINVAPGIYVQEGDVLFETQFTGAQTMIAAQEKIYTDAQLELLELEKNNNNLRLHRNDESWLAAYDALVLAYDVRHTAQIALEVEAQLQGVELVNGRLPDGVTDQTLLALQSAVDTADQDVQAALAGMDKADRLGIADEAYQYVMKRRELEGQMTQATQQIVTLRTFERSSSQICATQSGYVIEVHVTVGQSWDGRSAALTMSATDATILLRADSTNASRAISEGAVVNISGRYGSAVKTSVNAVGYDSMGNPYIDAIVQQRDMTSLDTPANLMSKGITLRINYTAGSSTYLLPASAVRGSGDQRSVYTLKEVENSFGQITLIVEEQPITVLDESGDTVAVTGVPDHAKIAYMEDRAIGPGSEVMAYD